MVSGRGSNMQRLVETSLHSATRIDIVLVASNKPCAAIDFARDHGLATAIIDRSGYADRSQQEEALATALEAAKPDWIFLAGYMAILSAAFVARFVGRIINIHPSLLPEFKGLDTHARALAAGVNRHGASVHVVTAALDDGPIILQAALTTSADDDAESLARRVLKLEHQLYPLVLKSLAEGTLAITDGVPQWRDIDGLIAGAEPKIQPFLSTNVIWPDPAPLESPQSA